MKIALAVESFDPLRGAAEGFIFEMVHRFLRRKHDVHVVARHFSKAGLELPIVPHRIGGTWSPLRRAAAAEAKLHTLHADVVHDMGVTWFADIFSPRDGSPAGMWRRQLTGTAWWARPFKRFGARLSLRHRQRIELARRQIEASDSIVTAYSGMVADDYRSFHAIPADRIRMVRPGVDIKKFSPHIRKLRRETTRRKLGIGTKDLLLLSLADNYQQGTWKVAFRALRRLVRRRVPVHLVHADNHRVGPIQRMADRYGVAEQVTVVGRVADRLPYYAAADVFLAPTLYAPYSLTVLEAAACGLPCITTRQNGVADLLTDGADSSLLPGLSAARLAEHIESFCDPACRERMGLAARRTAMKYTLDRSVDGILQIYEEVVETRQQANGADDNILMFPHRGGRTPAVRRAA